MDRDLGTPKKSQAAHRHVSGWHMAGGARDSRFVDETDPPMSALYPTRNAAPSKAHDKDGTFNKEFNT